MLLKHSVSLVHWHIHSEGVVCWHGLCEISTQWVKSGGVATFLLTVESTFPILWYFRTQFFHRFWVC